MARGQAIGSMVFNRPQLIALDALQPIVNYLADPKRANASFKPVEKPVTLLASDFDSDAAYRRYQLLENNINPDTMTGVLDIQGVLTYRSGEIDAECNEMVSYESLKRQTEKMVDLGVERIVMMQDSSGGAAYGLFAAASYIKKLARDNNISLVSYVDGVSYSASYGLSVIADELIVNPQAGVGSVGVVVALYNDTKMLENAGLSRQFVFAGDNKIPFDKDGDFTEQFISDLQKSVDKTYKSFVSHVAKNRGMTEQQIVDTQASVYDADEALELGLVDKVMELEDFEILYGLKSSLKNGGGTLALCDNPDKNGGTMKDGDNTKMAQLLKTDENQPTSQDNVDNSQALVNDSTDEKLELQKTNKSLSDTVAELTQKLNSVSEENKSLKAKIKEQEMSQRTEQRRMALQEALGKDNDNIETLLSSTESLNDEQFEQVAKSFGVAQEAKQEAFAELGGEGQESSVQLSLTEQLKQRAASMKRQA